MKKSNFHVTVIMSVLASALLTPTGLNAAPLLEYKFNETGTPANNTGSLGSAANGTMKNSSFAATDLHSGAGTGVSGAPSDLAFDNTASTAMGNAGGSVQGPAGQITNSLKSFTLTGWMKNAATTGSGGRIFFNDQFGTPWGRQLYWNVGGVLALQVGDGSTLSTYSSLSSTYSAAAGTSTPWVFFAVTFDANVNKVNFYLGDTSSSVTLANTLTSTQTTSDTANSNSFGIGNSQQDWGGYIAFDGMLDNIRLFGAVTGSTGALTLSELETIRFADAVPEPASVSLLVLGLGAIFLHCRRKS